MAANSGAARKTVRAFRAYIDLLEAADWIRAYMAGQLNSFDLTMSEFRLLELLYRDGPMYREAIAGRFQCTPHAVGRVMERLRKQGWVQGEEGRLDPIPGRETARTGGGEARGKRIVLLSLTTEGKKVIANVLPKHARVVKALMRVLDAREQETLSRVCRKLWQGDVVKFVKEISRRKDDVSRFDAR